MRNINPIKKNGRYTGYFEVVNDQEYFSPDVQPIEYAECTNCCATQEFHCTECNACFETDVPTAHTCIKKVNGIVIAIN